VLPDLNCSAAELPPLASLRRDIARSAQRLGTRVVRAMSPAGGYWVAHVLRRIGKKYRDLLLDRTRDRDDDAAPEAIAQTAASVKAQCIPVDLLSGWRVISHEVKGEAAAFPWPMGPF
jgi:hypothetical protein